ncbi:unannotated protein [freshwater metagenome]|uniref:Unannotated protein n=1 Tax=freshwater metagenome TaxID=449393 RepID=A0A6J7RR79_9ZZZZ
MSSFNSSVGLVAVVACAIAAIALIGLIVVIVMLRRLRRDQRLVIGDSERDITAHAADLERQFVALHDHLIDIATRLDGRVAKAETRLDSAISHRSVVRYDAYNELSGHQSVSIALLDSHRSGIVISSIQHRDQARFYIRQIEGGKGTVELSPEEQQAVKAAISGEVLDVVESP